MLIKENITTITMLLKLNNIINENKKSFTKEELDFISRNYLWGLRNNHAPCILSQIYDELDLIEDDKNIYLGFCNLIDNIFGLEHNILEVGGGIFPRLATHIALRQQKGKITVIDPRLSKQNTNIPNLKLQKEQFSNNMIEDNTSLIIAQMPYGITEKIIKSACSRKIDFIIALGDAQIENSDWINEDIQKNWEANIIYDARKLIEENNLGTLEIASLEEYGNNYPVIYNKRK